MIWLPNIDTLTLVGVFDRGVPNRERIVLRALQSVEMAQYGIIVGWNDAGPDGPIRPFNDLFYWFGDGVVQPNETIFVYTGKGEARKTTVEGSNAPAYAVHWGKANTMFADSRVVPAIISMGQILVAKPPANAPQLANLTKSR